MVIMEPQPAKITAELRMVKHLLEEAMAVEEVGAMDLLLLPVDTDLLLLLADTEVVDLLLLPADTEVADLEADTETNQAEEDMTEVIFIYYLKTVYLHNGQVWYPND